MIKAIIFDCFGVLATEAWVPFKAKYFGKDPNLYEEASNLGRQANSGLISFDEVIERVSAMASMTPDKARRIIRQNVPNEPLFDYISNELKPLYKLGFLSNVADDYMRQIFTPEQLGLFDAVTLSYKTGYIKPLTQAYTIVADRLGVTPAECVLVDDKEVNVTGAREAGMQAVLYQSLNKFKTELEKILADPES
ncbi:MAG TPA: HAD-IA family hydrolase [Candidatus Saccharimonadales bacterium]|jgi:putative hydrolase of the HAD superfamily|nr:HAD-IA family hydrolase [Candidatus Saccharimonadales bacterium]